MTYRAVDTYRDLNLDVVVKENFPLNVAARHPETLQLHPLRGMEDIFTKTLQRFEEEAELLATLNHPNIVRVSAHFSELNTAYYVMPHIGGIELYRALPPADELSEAELKPVLRSLLEALQYIHDFKLLHRDIKPNNVLLDTKSTPILIDFGLVRSTDTFRTLTRNYTPGYAPVEQISGSGKSGPWTDMYSLGATCYALITGSAPPDSLARLEDDEYSPLLSQPELLNRYSTSLLAGIDRALQMKRADRWQNAQEWMENLNAAEPASVPAPPPQQPEPVLSQQEARRLLQKQKISPNIYDTQLRMAAKAGNSKQLRLLIAAGANVKKVDRRTYPPLYLAIRHDHIECVKLLIEAGADVNKANKDGSTPLYWAAEKPNTECVKLLIEAGADVNMATNDDSTPLHKAAENGRSECVKLLIEAGADVNMATNDDSTPLQKAAENGHSECVKLLIEAGADVNKAEEFGWTPLYTAAYHGHTECVKLLIEAGAKVNTEEEYDISPLTLAADWGYTECMRLLLDAGGRANTKDDDGNTPLHKVAENGHSECVTLLLEAIDIDVNKENEDGNTPLHMAAENGHSECV
ncbi:MAG: ankyrin repeat domain-containing protein, partial [Akkermansia sp.]|nr:ankyrin repeat domain-containing protein [Akkermansia sp.]